MHDGIANELDGYVLDHREILLRHQVQSGGFEKYLFVVILRDVFRQRLQRAAEAAGGRGLVRTGHALGLELRGGSRKIRRFNDRRAVVRGGMAMAAGVRLVRGAGRGQSLHQGELAVHLIQFHRERQKIAAGEPATEA